MLTVTGKFIKTLFINIMKYIYVILFAFLISCKPKTPGNDDRKDQLNDPISASISDSVNGRQIKIYSIGDTKINIIIERPDTTGVYYFNMHENEFTSVKAIKSVIKNISGTLVYLKAKGTRNINFKTGNMSYEFDPNRIFTDAGIKKTLSANSTYNKQAETEIKNFAKFLLDSVLIRPKIIIALHNNTNGELSITSFTKGGKYSSDVITAHNNKSIDADNFYYVTRQEEYSDLVNLNLNVALQNNINVEDDGSLSVYCGKNFIPYINVETEHNKLEHQIEMVNEIQFTIKRICNIK